MTPAFANWIVRMRDIGVADQDMSTIRRIRTLNIVVLLACLFTLSYTTFYALYDASYFRVEITFLLVMSAIYPMTFFATRANRVETGMWMLILTGLLHIGIINWLLGASGGALSYLLALPFIVTLVVREDDRFTIWPVAIAVSAIFFVVTFSGREGSISELPETTQHVFFLANVIGAVLLACGISLCFRWLIAQAEANLAAEKARSDRLLRAILPDPIANQLKADETRVIAQRYASATAVLADIVGFTQRSAQVNADQVVSDLNRVFSRIDDLAELREIEKIKTIGDAYFAVCGLPDPVPNHAQRVADFALDLQVASADWSNTIWPELSFRVVIHTGPMVAGVIGRTKFAYDVWGDTINTAARLEKLCAPGEVLITDAVVAALPDRYVTEAIGEVDVRDKGKLQVHRLLHKKPA